MIVRSGERAKLSGLTSSFHSAVQLSRVFSTYSQLNYQCGKIVNETRNLHCGVVQTT